MVTLRPGSERGIISLKLVTSYPRLSTPFLTVYIAAPAMPTTPNICDAMCARENTCTYELSLRRRTL